MSAPKFRDFFTALWGKDKPPFAWQERLAARVLGSDAPNDSGEGCSPWPQAIALPTAAGKTACMDIAIFALAAQALRIPDGGRITAPRRIFFVVDRRVIVDEAYDRARKLASKLDEAKQGVLREVADSLRRISHGSANGFEVERPLTVHMLRGGMYRSDSWARNPLQPAVIASTVDQVGSRLLFRAYGRRSGTWPIYAGLVANDSLILLDEAHCAQPFMQTLHSIQKFRNWAESSLGRQFNPVVMSATPPSGLTDVFLDNSGQAADPTHPLGKRQLAPKRAVLSAVAKASGKGALTELSKALAQAAIRLVNSGLFAVVVFCNRVVTARKTFSTLSHMREDAEVVLLTGRMRSVDKDNAARRLRSLDLYSNRSSMRQPVNPIIVVATQTLEVGADLDFDGLVTECASLDALRQRFGRLNRTGRAVDARAEILIRGDQVNMTEKNRDPVYGQALSNTWKWLNERKGEEEVDFGIASLNVLLDQETSLGHLNAPSLNAPVMLPAHIDCWAQTSPEPAPLPDVALFLHGPRESAPDVQVCWRADIDLSRKENQKQSIESLQICPPSSVETLPVPIGVFKRWLVGAGDTEDQSSDVEGLADYTSATGESGDHANRRVIRWRGMPTTTDDITSDAADIRPGETIVIPAKHPGDPNQIGDLPLKALEHPGVLDIGDRAHRLARAKPVLRLHPAIVQAWPDSVPAKMDVLSLLEDIDTKYEEDSHAVAAAVRDVLSSLDVSQDLAHWDWLRDVARELRNEYPTEQSIERACRLIGGESLVLSARHRVSERTQDVDHFSDEDDSSSSGISHSNGRPVTLRTHLNGVEAYARRHAEGCGLSVELCAALARAGLLHDIGKADRRFQSLLRGGSPWFSEKELLAKSADMRKSPDAKRRAREESGYPKGGRHELLSVRMAENALTLLPDQEELRDLVLHLVASHHGYCRPFAPVVADDEPVHTDLELSGEKMTWCGPTKLERLDSGVADRFWQLTRRYGWWGLAWLESLLRLADRRRSEWEETHDASE